MHSTAPFLRTSLPTSVALQCRATLHSSPLPLPPPLLCGAQFGTVPHSFVLSLRRCAVPHLAPSPTAPFPPSVAVSCTATEHSSQLPSPPPLLWLFTATDRSSPPLSSSTATVQFTQLHRSCRLLSLPPSLFLLPSPTFLHLFFPSSRHGAVFNTAPFRSICSPFFVALPPTCSHRASPSFFLSSVTVQFSSKHRSCQQCYVLCCSPILLPSPFLTPISPSFRFSPAVSTC